MENFSLTSSDQPVVAFLGLKRKQWPMRSQFEAIARQWLESTGVNVRRVECFKKINGNTPHLEYNEVNIFLRLEGRNSVNFY